MRLIVPAVAVVIALVGIAPPALAQGEEGAVRNRGTTRIELVEFELK